MFKSPFVSAIICASAVMLGACDSGAPAPAQQQGELPGAKGSLAGTGTDRLDRSQAGELMPAMTLIDPEGNELNLAALQGQPVLVNLWATWCAPCVKEMPLLDELAADYEGSVRVVTVSQDLQGAEKVSPFFDKYDFEYLQPWLDTDNALGFALGGGGLPVTVLYDETGREVWRVAGDYDWASPEARGLVEEAL